MREELKALLIGAVESAVQNMRPEDVMLGERWVYRRDVNGQIQGTGSEVRVPSYTFAGRDWAALAAPLNEMFRRDYPTQADQLVGTALGQHRVDAEGLIQSAAYAAAEAHLLDADVHASALGSIASIERFLDNDRIQTQFVAPILNFNAETHDDFQLLPNVVVHWLTDDELTTFYGGSHAQGPIGMFSRWPEWVFKGSYDEAKVFGM
jgi:hypothetical protein